MTKTLVYAVSDKIIVELMKVTKSPGGLILPSNVAQPQAYGKVVSCGEKVETVSIGDYLIFHPGAGMDMLLNQQIYKVLKYDEIYGKLNIDEIKESLEVLKIGAPATDNLIIRPM